MQQCAHRPSVQGNCWKPRGGQPGGGGGHFWASLQGPNAPPAICNKNMELNPLGGTIERRCGELCEPRPGRNRRVGRGWSGGGRGGQRPAGCRAHWPGRGRRRRGGPGGHWARGRGRAEAAAGGRRQGRGPGAGGARAPPGGNRETESGGVVAGPSASPGSAGNQSHVLNHTNHFSQLHGLRTITSPRVLCACLAASLTKKNAG